MRHRQCSTGTGSGTATHAGSSTASVVGGDERDAEVTLRALTASPSPSAHDEGLYTRGWAEQAAASTRTRCGGRTVDPVPSAHRQLTGADGRGGVAAHRRQSGEPGTSTRE